MKGSKKSEGIGTPEELSNLMGGSAVARELLAADLSDLEPEEAAQMREDATKFLQLTEKMLGLLDERDKNQLTIEKVDALLQKNWEQFRGYSLREKAKFIRVFLVYWIPMKLSGRLKKLQ